MEERYEIREKIGQGGLGAVYRGYDTRMHREVAIKRISAANSDPALQEESTRQLIKEAGALASLQHPNIVTVYDVGSDEDGPFVVMELISGKTLDELIERAPLTWADFRELALQTEEALIAAQELDLIHSDIKPSNLMLAWLPSGKFQVKIVDFGLATLTQSQSMEEFQEIEAVFGSIFFMAPEQFERVPIDARTDMYALGCVFYQALTGVYPFKGETGHEVMVAHLQHQVVPLQDLRTDLPRWACDWIMWHINRQPQDRPESARRALQVFLQNDAIVQPPQGQVRPKPITVGPPRSRSATPTQGHSPIQIRSEAPRTATAPQPLLPPEGFKPSLYNEPPAPVATLSPPPTPSTKLPHAAHTQALASKKKRSGVGKILALAGVFIALVAALAVVFLKHQSDTANLRRFAEILTLAETPGSSEIPLSGPEIDQLLTRLENAETEEKRKTLQHALRRASSTDGTDLSAVLTRFATQSVQLLPEIRAEFITEVLAPHADPAMVASLTEFARSTNDTRSAVAALAAIRNSAGDAQFEALLTATQFHPNEAIRQAAADTAGEILRKSPKRSELLRLVSAALANAPNPKTREVLLALQKSASP
jgi:serine/threonine protein kinase